MMLCNPDMKLTIILLNCSAQAIISLTYAMIALLLIISPHATHTV